MGMREDLRIALTMLSISFLNELPFKGSYKGKRFMFEKENVADDEQKQKLVVYLWKDLYNFENTKREDMIVKEFEYTKDGIEKGIDFVEGTSI